MNSNTQESLESKPAPYAQPAAPAVDQHANPQPTPIMNDPQNYGVKTEHPVYIQPGYAGPVYVIQDNNPNHVSNVPIGMILFIAGFLLAPAWWVGACCFPQKSQFTPQEVLWRRLNIAMTVISAILLIALIVLWSLFLASPVVYM